MHKNEATSRELERDFQKCVLDLAKLYGWRRMHTRPARCRVRGKDTWRTPIEGDDGFPDLVLARDGVVICAELKSETGKPSQAQLDWLAALGGVSRLWRPSDWDDIHDELSARRTNHN